MPTRKARSAAPATAERTLDAAANGEPPTPDDLLRYTTAYIATSNALGDAIILLKRLQAITIDPDAVDQIVLKRRELEDEYATNERSFLAVHAGSMAMNPPSQEEVDGIVGLAAELAKLTQQRTTLSAVLALATDVANRFQDIRNA